MVEFNTNSCGCLFMIVTSLFHIFAANEDIAGTACKSINGHSGFMLLKDAINACASPGKYYKSVVIIQSSGHGKTFATIQLSKTLRLIYLQCMDKDDGRPCHPIIANAIKYLIEINISKDEREKRTAKFLSALLQAASKYESKEELNAAQFQSDRFIKRFDDIFSGYKPPNGTPEQVKSTLARLNTRHNDTVPSVNGPYNSDIKCIVFDEADAFVVNDGNDKEWSPLRVLRRLLSSMKMVGVFLSTSAHAAHLAPSHVGSGPTNGELIADFPFVTAIVHPDLFVKDVVLKSRSVQLFTLGRPVWYCRYKYSYSGKNMPMRLLVQYASNLLLNYRRQVSGKELEGLAQLEAAAFAGILVPWQPHTVSSYRYVSHYLATVVSMSSSTHCVCNYTSEPILAEAVGSLMLYDSSYSMLKILSAIEELIKTQYVDASKGVIGEFVAAWTLLSHMTMLRTQPPHGNLTKESYSPDEIENSCSSEVSVINFVNMIEPRADSSSINPCDLSDPLQHLNIEDIGSDLTNALDGYTVNFTHFMRVAEVNDAVITEAYRRCAAIVLPNGHRGADLLVVMYRENSKQYGAMSIQVKNSINRIPQKAAAKFVYSANSAIYSNCNVFENGAEISMLIAVGSGGVEYWRDIVVNQGAKISDSIGSRVKVTRKTDVMSSATVSIAATIDNFSLLSKDLREKLNAIAVENNTTVEEKSIGEILSTYGTIGILASNGTISTECTLIE